MIRFQFSGSIEELRSLMDPSNLQKAERSALKATQQQVATRVSKKVRDTYNVTTRAIADRLKMGLTNNERDAYIKWVGTRIGLINFGAQFRRVNTQRGKRWGATAKIKRDERKSVVPGGFIAMGRNGNVQVFRRIDQRDAKSKLRRMAGPAIPQMVQAPEVIADAEQFVAGKYPEILANRMAFFFEKQVSK